jgi:hypothetical protein
MSKTFDAASVVRNYTWDTDLSSELERLSFEQVLAFIVYLQLNHEGVSTSYLLHVLMVRLGLENPEEPKQRQLRNDSAGTYFVFEYEIAKYISVTSLENVEKLKVFFEDTLRRSGCHGFI